MIYQTHEAKLREFERLLGVHEQLVKVAGMSTGGRVDNRVADLAYVQIRKALDELSVRPLYQPEVYDALIYIAREGVWSDDLWRHLREDKTDRHGRAQWAMGVLVEHLPVPRPVTDTGP